MADDNLYEYWIAKGTELDKYWETYYAGKDISRNFQA